MMPKAEPATVQIPGYCALCISRCGSVAVVENGRFVALQPDPSHPTGQALCAKGRATPEPVSRPDLVDRYPLILTCAKHTLFCESQHRALPSLRQQALEPEVELHSLAAAERGIRPGDWVQVETLDGSVRARARLNDTLEPRVVCGQHGWWQACPEIGAPGYDAFSPAGANYNLLIGHEAVDPISGSVPHRAYLCQVRLVDGEA